MEVTSAIGVGSPELRQRAEEGCIMTMVVAERLPAADRPPAARLIVKRNIELVVLMASWAEAWSVDTVVGTWLPVVGTHE